jgi:hypothetical protein
MMVSLLIVAVLFVVTRWIFHLLLETSATRRVLGRTPATNEGDTTGAVLMASDYATGWSSDNRPSFDAAGWDAGDCGSGADAGGGGGDCGGSGDGGGGGGD